MVASADAEVVGGCCIDVQLRWDAGPLQGQVRHHAVIGVADDIVTTVRQKDRGCLRLTSVPQKTRITAKVRGSGGTE
jgi:hypothetical protein